VRHASPSKRWLLRVGVALSVAALGALTFPIATPPPRVRPFLLYYGYVPPGGGGRAASALAARFHGYPLVVFGWALRRARLARRLRADLPRTRLYGYVDTGHVNARAVREELRALGHLGYAGALLDDVGIGLSASPTALQAIVDEAYADHLSVLLNAWSPQVVAALRLRPSATALLCENWVFSRGAWHVSRPAAVYRSLYALERRGVAVFMIVTAASAPVAPRTVSAGIRQTVYEERGQFLALSGPYYSAQSGAIVPAAALRRLLDAIAY
jgi:hypothetical protein